MSTSRSIAARVATAILGSVPAAAAVNVVEEQKLLASDAALGDEFGRAVAVDAETLVVGAPNAGGTGAVYVFRHNGTSFVEEAKLTTPDIRAGDGFGSTLSLHGQSLLIGAPGHDENGLDAGTAYVFVRFGGVWRVERELHPLVARAGDLFGSSVALYGGTAVVGAPRTAASSPSTGAAYVFARGASSAPRGSGFYAEINMWRQEARLSASDAQVGDRFGGAVALRGGTIAVGAILADGREAESGAVYVYVRSAGAWTEDDKLQAADGETNDVFGVSVGIFGDKTISIGAAGDDDAGSNAGAAYKFLRFPAGWGETGKITGRAANDHFGHAVARSYLATLVGARFDDQQGTDAGTANLYDSFVPVQTFVASDASAGDLLGCAVAVDPCWAVVGACGKDDIANDAGAVYVYLLMPPSATLANGSGVNPVILRSTVLPVIGHDWEVEIDGSAYPTAGLSQLIVEAALGTPFPTAFGEILLDRSAPPILVNLAIGPGITLHKIPIPNDPYIIGYQAAAQGVLRAGVPGIPILTLTNAEELVVGCHADSSQH